MSFWKSAWSALKSIFSISPAGLLYNAGKKIAGLGSGSSPISEWIKGASGSGLTSAQIQANDFSALEAQKNRDWQVQMSNTAYQRQVEDMKAAGLNPMAMYGGNLGSGASTPSGSAAAAGGPEIAGGLFDTLMNVAMTKARIDNLRADTQQKYANANNAAANTRLTGLIADYYPKLTSSQIDQIQQGISESMSNILVNNSRVSNIDADTALKNSQKVINDIEANHRDRLLSLEEAFKSAETDSAKASAAQSYAEAFMKQYTLRYLRSFGFLPGSSDITSVASAIFSSLNGGNFGDGEYTGVIPQIVEGVKNGFQTIDKVSDKINGVLPNIPFPGDRNGWREWKIREGAKMYMKWKNLF